MGHSVRVCVTDEPLRLAGTGHVSDRLSELQQTLIVRRSKRKSDCHSGIPHLQLPATLRRTRSSREPPDRVSLNLGRTGWWVRWWLVAASLSDATQSCVSRAGSLRMHLFASSLQEGAVHSFSKTGRGCVLPVVHVSGSTGLTHSKSDECRSL